VLHHQALENNVLDYLGSAVRRTNEGASCIAWAGIIQLRRDFCAAEKGRRRRRRLQRNAKNASVEAKPERGVA